MPPKDLGHESNLLRRRLVYVSKIKEHISREDSLVSCTVRLYEEVLDAALAEVVAEALHDVASGADDPWLEHGDSPAPAPGIPPPRPLPSGHLDAFGRQVPAIATDQVACPRCNRKIVSARFAPHLDKCMGGGRNGRRR